MMKRLITLTREELAMRAILVDDEQLALDFMEHNLNQIGNVEIIGKYLNPLIAKEAILDAAVDVAFLDINLPEMTGLELAEVLLESNPYLLVIFVTAYDRYAIEAFELNALDYIVKPVNIDRLKMTISRVESLLENQVNRSALKSNTLHINVCEQLLIKNSSGELERVSWRTTRAQEMFLFLLHNQDKFIRKSLLIELFWPDFEKERAYSQLYSTIYQIRKTLLRFEGHFEIKNTTEGYHFEIKDVAIDIVEWEKQIKQAPPLSTKTVNHYIKIMESYTGPYLVDHDYLWAEPERYRLELLWIDQSIKIADWYYDHGHFKEANLVYQRISESHPEIEEASFKQMKIYATLGNQVMVMQTYDNLELALREKLDLPPHMEISEWFIEWNKSL